MVRNQACSMQDGSELGHKTIWRIARRRALGTMGNQDRKLRGQSEPIWPIAKCLTKRHEPKATTAIHAPSGLVFYANDKINVIANYLENLFTSQKVCDTGHERLLEALVQALLTTVNENPPQLNFDHVTSE
jgi:hypothetical protein